MLELVLTMWESHLERIGVAKHLIDLRLDASPVHSTPYRAGSWLREFHLVEIDRFFEHGVIELATTQWAAPIVFAPKNNGTF